MRVAIAFICKSPTEDLLLFSKEINQSTTLESFIIVDDFSVIWEDVLHETSNVISVPDSICFSKGFYGTNINKGATHINRDVVAMDKCLYYFTKVNTNHDFVLIIEDDVFIPSIQALLNLVINSINEKADLVIANNHYKSDNVKDWHWAHIFEGCEPPYYYSMACVVGLSKNMINLINDRVINKGKLFYLEAMFNTLANQAGLNVYCPKELKSIVWQGEWNRHHFTQLPNNFFHPLKESNHRFTRSVLKGLLDTNTISNKALPDFLK